MPVRSKISARDNLIERLLSLPAGSRPGGGRAAPRIVALGALAVILAATLVYPVLGTGAWLRSRAIEAAHGTNPTVVEAQSPGADADALFRALYPDDAAAAAFLARMARPGENVLEETGEPYTWSSRISTFSGVPAVLGWGNHEAIWRHDWESVRRRSADVEALYRDPVSAGACHLMRPYGVRWVVVGPRERQRYGDGPGRFAAAGKKAFESGGTAVYDLTGVCGEADLPGRSR